ncbi:MAG: tetratricopeptide repeat protein [Elusimicrobia bacterium]|nr:tetratricopeptide repeat protein [Elusimicrobiota bacterium]
MSTKKLLTALIAILLVAPSASAAKKSASSGYKLFLSQGAQSMKTRSWDKAIRSFSKAAKTKKTAEAYFMLAYAHYQKAFVGGAPEAADSAQAAQAIAAYNVAISLDPELGSVTAPYRVYHSMGLCYEAVGADEKAIEAYRRAFQASPDNPMLPLYAARLRYRMNDVPRSAANLALALRKARATNKDKSLVQMVKTDPFFSSMLKSDLNRGIVAEYESGMNPKQALAQAADTSSKEELRDAIRDTPPDQRKDILAETQSDSAVLRRLSNADEEFKFGRFRDSVDGYNETLVLNQESAILNATQLSLVYERMGTAYNKLGLTNGAVKALRYAVQEMPGNSSAYYQLALAYAVSGKYSQSLRALGEAFKNAPSDAELRKMSLLARTDTELEPIRDLPGFQAVLGPHMERLQARR